MGSYQPSSLSSCRNLHDRLLPLWRSHRLDCSDLQPHDYVGNFAKLGCNPHLIRNCRYHPYDGDAVDANVLVFERIREEFNLTQRIASAVSVGYRKAFSAIFDSNITTIIAAIILLQFNSGPSAVSPQLSLLA